MIRTTTLALMLTLASPAYAQKAEFEFRGETTSQIIDTAGRKGCSADEERAGVVSCYGSTPIGGVDDMFLGTSYYNGKLYYVGGLFKQGGYLTLLSAFTAKYGSPKMETRQWQSRGGVKIDNEVAVWTFAGGGNLELHSVGGKLGESRFQFSHSGNTPAPTAPKVDF